MRLSSGKQSRKEDGYGTESWRCDQNEESTSLWGKRMGTDAGGHGYPASMPWMRPPGHAAKETGGKGISGIFVKLDLRLVRRYVIIFDCDT